MENDAMTHDRIAPRGTVLAELVVDAARTIEVQAVCDLTRALRAVRAAGIEARVDVMPDGRISIVPIAPTGATLGVARSWRAVAFRRERVKMPRHLPKYIMAFVDRHGKVRHYFRRAGFRRAPLPGLPWSTEFMTAYQEALAGDPVPAGHGEIGISKSKPGSVAAAVAGYLGSGEFTSFAEVTKKDRRYILEKFRSQHGDKSIATVQSKHVELWISNKAATAPSAALHLLIALRELMRWSVRVGLRPDDPTAGVRRPRIRSEGYYPWTEDDIAKFEDAHPIGTRARLAMALALFTGQRRQTVIQLGRQHVRDGVLHIRQQKTRTHLTIPVHPELQVIIDATPTENLSFLTTQYGRPFTSGAFSIWFKGECRKAGLPERAAIHGLRKAASRRLAEAGCSANQIAAVTGHRSLREVARYTASAEQAHLARQGMDAVVRQGARGKPDKDVKEDM